LLSLSLIQLISNVLMLERRWRFQSALLKFDWADSNVLFEFGCLNEIGKHNEISTMSLAWAHYLCKW